MSLNHYIDLITYCKTNPEYAAKADSFLKLRELLISIHTKFIAAVPDKDLFNNQEDLIRRMKYMLQDCEKNELNDILIGTFIEALNCSLIK